MVRTTVPIIITSRGTTIKSSDHHVSPSHLSTTISPSIKSGSTLKTETTSVEHSMSSSSATTFSSTYKTGKSTSEDSKQLTTLKSTTDLTSNFFLPTEEKLTFNIFTNTEGIICKQGFYFIQSIMPTLPIIFYNFFMFQFLF